MSDDWERRPRWNEDEANRKARDFVDPPREDPPDETVPVEPPDQQDNGGGE